MGAAARRKSKFREEALVHSIRMRRARFEHFTMGSRRSLARYMSEEISWWSNAEETILGFVFRDVTDDDYGWIIMARDGARRFRAIDLRVNDRSAEFAEVGLRLAIADIVNAGDLDARRVQGDEPEAPIDLLAVGDTPDKKLHPYFLQLRDATGRAPARAVIGEIGPWLDPKDPHLVQEFQQHQFDQRLWELYLWACFREMSFDVVHLEAPDFRCVSPQGEFAVEATTVAPSTMGPLAAHPNPKTREEMAEFLNNYMPLKFGSSLMSKLNKVDANGRRYWEMEGAKGKPFLLAVADFHRAATEEELGSMTYTQSSIWQYLYGTRVDWEIVDGKLVLVPQHIETHAFNEKKAPSGFFDQPGAENVSAVLFSNAGTIAKFDRIGVLAGFAESGHQYFRMGLRSNPDPNSPVGTPFFIEVGGEDYEEMWSDELQVFHNPNAIRPLDKRVFGGIAQHWFRDGNLHSLVPPDHVLSSYTMILQVVGDGEDLLERGDQK